MHPFLPGSSNRRVYDLSSNSPVKTGGIYLGAFEAAQGIDDDVAQLQQFKGFHFSNVMFKDVPILCDVSTRIPHPVVPSKFRHQVFMVVHRLSHAGIRATWRLITKWWLWMKMNHNVEVQHS